MKHFCNTLKPHAEQSHCHLLDLFPIISSDSFVYISWFLYCSNLIHLQQSGLPTYSNLASASLVPTPHWSFFCQLVALPGSTEPKTLLTPIIINTALAQLRASQPATTAVSLLPRPQRPALLHVPQVHGAASRLCFRLCLCWSTPCALCLEHASHPSSGASDSPGEMYTVSFSVLSILFLIMFLCRHCTAGFS